MRSGRQFTQALPERLLTLNLIQARKQAFNIFCVPPLQLATPALLTEFMAHEES